MTTPVEIHPTSTTDSAPATELGRSGTDDSAAGVLRRVAATRSSRGYVRTHGTHAISGLSIRVSYPRRNLALISLAGELDLCTVERLRDVLAPRLDAVVDTVVLDLTQLTFLAVTGLDLLCRARARAVAAGIDLRVVVAGREVARPLRITGLDRLLTCYPTVAAAVDPAGD